MFIEVQDPAGVTHLVNADDIVKVVHVEDELPMVVMQREKIMVKAPSFAELSATLLGVVIVRKTLGCSTTDARAEP